MYWIPVAIIYYFFYAWASKACNDTQQIKYVGLLFVLQAFGLWPLIAYYSKNVLRDGIIFDLMILIGFYSGMIYLGAGKNFTILQWIGVALSIIGIGLMK